MDVKKFDRSKQTVVPTDAGEKLIEQAKIILQEVNRMKLIVDELKDEIKG